MLKPLTLGFKILLIIIGLIILSVSLNVTRQKQPKLQDASVKQPEIKLASIQTTTDVKPATQSGIIKVNQGGSPSSEEIRAYIKEVFEVEPDTDWALRVSYCESTWNIYAKNSHSSCQLPIVRTVEQIFGIGEKK